MIFGAGETGSYTNPKPFWWLRTPEVSILATRFLQAFRIVGWIIGTVVTFFIALFVSTVWPVVLWVWGMASAFLNFCFGLMIGEINVQSAFFPIFVFFGSALLWVFWPQLGCFIEKTWPVLRNVIDLLNAMLGLGIQIVNVAFRCWNMMVQVIGFFIYFVLDILVEIFRLSNVLLGEANISAYGEAYMGIALQLTEMIINATQAIISIAPAIIQVFANVIGSCMTVILEISPVLLQVTTVLFRVISFQIGPIVRLIVRVVQFVQKNFFLLRSLLEVAGAVGAASAHDVKLIHEQAELWHTFGESAGQYYTPASARETSANYIDINDWLLNNPPGSFSNYELFKGYQRVPPSASNDYFTGRDLLDIECESKEMCAVKNKLQWHDDKRHTQFQQNLGLFSATLNHDNSPHKQHFEHLPDDPDLEKRLPCKSRFCGGEGATVAHPLKQLREKQAEHQTLLSDSHVKMDLRSHRKRHAHAAGLLHMARYAVHHFARRYWYGKDGEHMKEVVVPGLVKRITGHDSVHAAVETFLSKQDHHMDNFGSVTPVLSEWFPFNLILALHDPDVQDMYYGNWAKKRRFFYKPVTDEYTGETRNVLHVTLKDHGENSTHAQVARMRMGTSRTLMQTDEGAGGNDQSVDKDFLFVFLPPYTTGFFALYEAGNLLEPALPVMKMLYTRDCVHEPMHPWCLPEIPEQLTCLITHIIALIPRNLPVKLCGYEEECADIGFCIPKRPPIELSISFITIFPFLFNACWLRNIFVWLFTPMDLALPIVRFGFHQGALLVPILGDLIFRPLLHWLPPPISLQHAVCLLIFSFSFAEFLFYVWCFSFLVPLILWAYATIVGLLSVIDMIRGMELALYERLGQDPVIANMRELRNKTEVHKLHGDKVYGPWEQVLRHPGDPDTVRYRMDPYANLENHLQSAGFGVPGRQSSGIPRYPDFDAATRLSPGQLNQAYLETNQWPPVPLAPIDSDIESAHRAHITPHAQVHCWLLADACKIGEKLFGKPSRAVTIDDVANFKARWAPFIVSGHYTFSWFRRAMAKHNYEKDRWATREPAALTKKYF